MSDHTENNKRIAKNTMMLYMRMLLSMVVSLYTSRVVLNTLGIEDYGIYNVVGGVVVMFSFLNATMSGATSRFLTYELGVDNRQRLNAVFSSALLIHIGIAILIFIVAETIGLWFLNNKLIIPEERLLAAGWVYQFSVFSALVTITQVPYNACIIAHEKMSVYAYVEILNVLLKLLIVYLLQVGSFDKLILYGFLVMCVSVFIAFVYRFYCMRNFAECHFRFVKDSKLLKSMFLFSGWDLLGHLGYTIKIQGTSFLLNMFFGPVLNAANGIATVVQGVVMSFSTNVVTAVRPQIVKAYASGNRNYMIEILTNSARYTFLLMSLVVIPVVLEMNFVLKVWLREVPAFTVVFCQLSMLLNCISTVSQIVYVGIHATGSLRLSSICRSLLYLSVPLAIYVLFVIGFSPVSSYIYILIVQFILSCCDLAILKCTVSQLNLRRWFSVVWIKNITVVLLASIVPCVIRFSMAEGWGRLVGVTFSSVGFILFFTYFIVLNTSSRFILKSYVRNFIRK